MSPASARCGQRLRRALDHRPGARELVGGRRVGLRAARPEQHGEPVQRERRDAEHRRAQRPRRVRAEREPEPGAAGPVGLLVREQADPQGGGDDRDHRQQPGGVERLVEQRAAAVELPAEGQVRAEDDPEDDRLLVVEPLHEGRDDARPEQRDREHPRAVEPAREPAREHEQGGPDHAADEVRHLQHGQRHDAPQERRGARPRRGGRPTRGARSPRPSRRARRATARRARTTRARRAGRGRPARGGRRARSRRASRTPRGTGRGSR